MMAEKNRLNDLKTIARILYAVANNLSADPNIFSLRYYCTLAKVDSASLNG